MWRAQVEALRASGREAVAIDLPGHGTRAGRFTLDGCVAAVDEAVASLGGRPVVVVGLSLGGYVALRWAARRPASVAAVVAAGCSGVPGGPLTRAWTLAARAIAHLPDRGAALNEAAVRAAIPAAGAADLAAGGYALDVMVDMLTEMSRADPLADVAALTCPVWLVNGRWDHFRLGERRFRRAAPHAEVRIVPHATHLVSLVAPVPFTRVLLEALADVDARSALGAEQAPRAHATDDPRRVRDDDDVVAEELEHRRTDPAGVPAADVQAVPVEHRP